MPEMFWFTFMSTQTRNILLMKQRLIYTLIALTTLLMTACKKGDDGPAGPAGPDGPAGPAGPQGAAGNANVVQYNFPGYNFISAGFSSVNLQITTTLDTMNRSAYLIYLVRASGNTYPLPGWGLSGDSEYRVLIYHSGGKANLTITKHSGPGEEYGSIRVIRIYSNATATGGRSANPEVDTNDYAAVCRYYGLTPY
jgi:hypothetical protein